MSDLVAEFLKSSNFIQLIAIGIMFWFFYTRLDAKITSLDAKITSLSTELRQEIATAKAESRQEHAASKTELKQEIAASKTELKREIADVKAELKDLGEKVEDVDRRLCRIEGSLATQGHCLFGQREAKKAE